MTRRMGYEASLHRNTGVWATPTFSEITLVREATVSMERNEADATARGDAFRSYVTGPKDVTLEFEIVKDNTDAGYQAVRDAFNNGTFLELLALDGDNATGNEGLRGEWEITAMNESQPLDDVVTENFTAKLSAKADNPPDWYTVP